MTGGDQGRISARPVTGADVEAVVAFLTGTEWPFHTLPVLTDTGVRRRLADGWLDAPGTETHWLAAGGATVGLLRLFDLDDGAPLFDLRLHPPARGRGLGTEAVRWLTGQVFTRYPAIERIEATTRVDNQPMRRALARAGWQKESHWRRSWPAGDGTSRDGVGYAVLRVDWQAGTITPVDWAG